MKKLDDLRFGFSDAENYRRKENKQFFNQIFLQTDAVKKLQDPSIYFLIGDKGAGKTAYAVSQTANPSRNSKSTHIFLRETDYAKFVGLKREKKLTISEYVDIWKLILLLSASKVLIDDSNIVSRFINNASFSTLKAAIKKYYKEGFDPEIVTALQLIENIEESAEFVKEAASSFDVSNIGIKSGFSGSLKKTDATKIGSEVRQERHRFQRNIFDILKILEPAIDAIKLKGNYTLFIDGIDVRPSSIGYSEYLECVKGLANAAWSLNNDTFSKTKDTKGRIKIVLLLRPDIFNSLGMQNRNTKIKDNSVVLHWVTDYDQHRNSPLFKLSDKLLSAQQETPKEEGDCWDYYLPFQAPNYTSRNIGNTSFVSFLRQTYHRPRDILTMIDTLNEVRIFRNRKDNQFTLEHVSSADFRSRFSEYLLGEIKDALSFYYDEVEFELFLSFFTYLNGALNFTYQEFQDAFSDFEQAVTEQGKRPGFMRTSDEFLQFLYDQNILSYIEDTEDETFIYWCFRERSLTNISPQVKFGVRYEIHYGLAKSLNAGKKFKKPAQRNRSVSEDKKSENKLYGKVVTYNSIKKFGFIRCELIPTDIFFHSSSLSKNMTIAEGMNVHFILEIGDGGRLRAKDID